jgi:hypothetical protein
MRLPSGARGFESLRLRFNKDTESLKEREGSRYFDFFLFVVFCQKNEEFEKNMKRFV